MVPQDTLDLRLKIGSVRFVIDPFKNRMYYRADRCAIASTIKDCATRSVRRFRLFGNVQFIAQVVSQGTRFELSEFRRTHCQLIWRGRRVRETTRNKIFEFDGGGHVARKRPDR